MTLQPFIYLRHAEIQGLGVAFTLAFPLNTHSITEPSCASRRSIQGARGYGTRM